MRFRRSKDPDRKPAKRVPVFPIRIDGEEEGKGRIWDMDDEAVEKIFKDADHAAFVLASYNDGEITCYIEKDSDA